MGDQSVLVAIDVLLFLIKQKRQPAATPALKYQQHHNATLRHHQLVATVFPSQIGHAAKDESIIGGIVAEIMLAGVRSDNIVAGVASAILASNRTVQPSPFT